MCIVCPTRSNVTSTNTSPPTPSKASTPLSRSYGGSNSNNRPPRGHPLLLNSNINSVKNNRTPPSNNIHTTPLLSPLHNKANVVHKPNTPVASRSRMEPRNLASVLMSNDSYDMPSEEEQLKWALNASKVLMVKEQGDDDSEDDDPELARVLEESKAMFEQCNNGNSSHSPSPIASPSLLGGGADNIDSNSNNNTGDSGYYGSSVDVTVDDELPHKVGGAKSLAFGDNSLAGGTYC